MMQAVVYDLMAAKPHEPADAHFTAAEFDLYKLGYDTALKVVARALDAAYQRYQLVEKTKRVNRSTKGGK